MAETFDYFNNNSDSDAENASPKKKIKVEKPGKAKRRSQKFREEWLCNDEFKFWLRPVKNNA